MSCHAVIVNADCSLSHCQEQMVFAGYGAYPYNCIAKDEAPQAPIFINCPQNHQTWCVGTNNQEEAEQ